MCFRGREEEREEREGGEGGRTHVYALSETAAVALLLLLVCNPIPLSNSVPHSMIYPLAVIHFDLLEVLQRSYQRDLVK